jgi:fibronectin-binding autotransporter adhesin
MRRFERLWILLIAIVPLIASPWNTVYADVVWTGDATYDLGSGTFYVGGSAAGALTINSGSGQPTTAPVAYIGRDSGVGGTVTVDGAGSAWIETGSVYVGFNGSGSLYIQNGGAVGNAAGYIAFGTTTGYAAAGTVTVSGSSTWTNSSTLQIGGSGNGTLNVAAGGSVSNTTAYIGFGANATAASAATVDGADSKWTMTGNLYVGYKHKGTLSITNGGTVSDVFGYVGQTSGVTAMATVDGAGSTWANSATLAVGFLTSGTLNITNGGVVTSGANSYIGGTATASCLGTVKVDGPGSTWTVMNGANLYIGGGPNTNGYGSGTLTISNRGAVSDSSGYMAYLGSSTSSITVSGSSTWTNSGIIYVGVFGKATLNVNTGGTVTCASLCVIGSRIGSQGTSSGTVIVDGAGSTFTCMGTGSLATPNLLAVGSQANGVMYVTNGGVVRVGTSGAGTSIGYSIGYGSSTSSLLGGTATVDGAGSMWIGSLPLFIAFNHNGTLYVTNGGAVSDANGYLGYGTLTGSSIVGTATVDGAGSTWTHSGTFTVGALNSGVLKITNGGSVSNTTGYVGYTGNGTATSAVTVDGGAAAAGATAWTNSSDLYVGYAHKGTLTIRNGGAVSDANGYIAYGGASSGTVTVSGAGSTWTHSGTLYVGYGAGINGIVVQTDGAVTASGGVQIGYNGTGSYNLSGGVLTTPAVTIGGGGGGTLNMTGGAANLGGGTIAGNSTAAFYFSGGTINDVALVATGVDVTGGTGAFYHSAGSAGAVSGKITGTGGLVKAGGGTVTFSGANDYNGLTTVKGGMLNLVGTEITSAPGAWNPALNLGGADIQAGKIVFDYATTGGTSPASAIKTILKTSYDGSKFASGQIFSSTCGTTTYGLGWVDDGSAVTVKIAVYGDADLSGVVGASDLSTVLTNFGLAGVWSTGDFDYSGIVGASDLSAVLTNFGQTLPTSLDISPYHLDADAIRALGAAGIAVVPEPGTLALLAAWLIGLIAYAWRKRREK